MKKIELRVDKQSVVNPTILLRQGDSNYHSVNVTLLDDNEQPLDITTSVITFIGETPTGYKIVDTNVNKSSDVGVFDYIFPNQASSSVGNYVDAYFKITDQNKQTSTSSFKITVLDSVDMDKVDADNYVSVIDGVIESVKAQFNSDLQEATGQIDTKVAGVGAQIDSQVATATTNLNGVVNGAKNDLSTAVTTAQSGLNTAVQTATDKLNQTIATGNYASQDYVQQTVTSGINAITKVANASHADVADSLALINGVTNITNMETWGSVLNHGATVTNGDITVNGAIHGTADNAKSADMAKALDENGGYKVATVTTTAGTNLAYVNTWGIINHGYATFDDLTLNGQLILPANQNLHYAKTVDNSGLVIELRRFQNVVSLNVGNYVSVTSAWNWVGTVPKGYRPVADSRFNIEVNGNKLISAVVGVDGHILITSIGTADGKAGTVWGSTIYFTADDMPG